VVCNLTLARDDIISDRNSFLLKREVLQVTATKSPLFGDWMKIERHRCRVLPAAAKLSKSPRCRRQRDLRSSVSRDQCGTDPVTTRSTAVLHGQGSMSEPSCTAEYDGDVTPVDGVHRERKSNHHRRNLRR